MAKKREANGMRVSFDLDEVLFVDPANHKTEPPLPYPLRNLFRERLRAGTPALIHDLQKNGFEVWVYTSSYRTQRYIRTLFRCYGVVFDGIVNAQRHQAEVQGTHPEPMPTKLPNKYKISLHVDDEAIVCTYGRTYGFDVYHLDQQEDNWHENIMKRVYEVKKHKFDRLKKMQGL